MKRLIVLVLTSVLIGSCQKDKSFETANATPPANSLYYIDASVNGYSRTFDFSDSAKFTDFGGGLKTLNLSGFASSDATSLEEITLTINFFDVTPTTGTYTEDYTGSDYVATGTYNSNSTTYIYTAGIEKNSAMPLSITITKLDSTSIEGTFKGAFYKTDVTSGEPSADFLTFTSGSFKLPIQ